MMSNAFWLLVSNTFSKNKYSLVPLHEFMNSVVKSKVYLEKGCWKNNVIIASITFLEYNW